MIPPELFEEVVKALQEAGAELEILDDPEFDWPLPDDLWYFVENADVCVRALERIYEATTDDGRRRIDRMITEEVERAYESVPARFSRGRVPISDEALRPIDSALESVRRARILSREVDEVIGR